MMRLSDGLEVPLVGYGTSRVLDSHQNSQEHLDAYKSIKTAICSGYRFIDTATFYMNEHIVGQAIRDCLDQNIIKSRSELIVCTKLWCTAHKRQSVMRACKQSLKNLQLDFVDLYLVHWPMAYAEQGDPIHPVDQQSGLLRYADTHFTETWRGMEDVKDVGLARSIGVSNFNHKQIEQILKMPCKYKPTVNQVECHPYLSQQKLHAYCIGHDIHLHAHCPLGSPASCAKPGQAKLLDDQLVNQLAVKYQKTPAQILIRYLVQRGIAALPKSTTPKRIRENLEVDFELNDEDLNQLLKLDRNLRYCRNADMDVSDHPLFPFNEEF